jgi:hypothetical protein
LISDLHLDIRIIINHPNIKSIIDTDIIFYPNKIKQDPKRRATKKKSLKSELILEVTLGGMIKFFIIKKRCLKEKCGMRM